jgi:hypothetical protein
MNIFLSIIAFIIIFFSFFKKRYNLVFSFLFASILANLFSFTFLGNIRFYSIICILYILFNHEFIRSFWKIINIKFWFKYELYILLITGLIFTIFLPWETQFVNRPFSQQLIPKAIIGYIRYLSDVSLVLIIPSLLFLARHKNSNKKINFIYYFLIFQLIFSLIDYYFLSVLRNLFFVAPEISERFMGFNHEPRALGRNALYTILIIDFLRSKYSSKNILPKVAKLLALTTLIISYSLSAYIAFFIITLLDINFKKFGYQFLRNISYIIIFLTFVSQIDFVKNITLNKLTNTFISVNELAVFNSDIFSYNNAYLNFIIDNPNYLISGTGPNLINFAYEDYAIQDYKLNDPNYFVSTTPTLGLFRILARSGIFGLLCYFLFYYNLRKKINISTNKIENLIFLKKNYLLLLILYTPFFFFNLGILIYYLNFIKQNDINR